MPRFDAIIFDLDGTLVDSAPDIAAAVDAALADFGRPALGVARVRDLVGDGATRLIERALAATAGSVGDGAAGADVAPVLDRFRVHYRAHLVVSTRVYDGIVDVLDAAAGVPLAVLTNKPGSMARPIVEALGLGGRFAAVVGDGDGFARKPEPDAALALCARLGASPARTLVVGDGLPDMALARAVGAPCAAASWGYVERARQVACAPTWIVDKPLELLAILDG